MDAKWQMPILANSGRICLSSIWKSSHHVGIRMPQPHDPIAAVRVCTNGRRDESTCLELDIDVDIARDPQDFSGRRQVRRSTKISIGVVQPQLSGSLERRGASSCG